MDRFQKRKQTRERRKFQQCRVFEIKIDKSRLSRTIINRLNLLFIESKWFYNYCLSQKDINNSDTTIKSVPVKVGDEFEDKTFNVLSGAMKQAIKTRLFGNLKSLSELKKKGHKVGKLKFKSHIDSVPLQQLHKTHKLDFDKSRIRIQNIKSWLRVRGLAQINLGKTEIANATLMRKCDDFFLHVTTFEDKKETIIPEQSIGIDFGCETQLTLSDGTKIQFQVPVSKSIKRLDRKINRKQFNDKKRSRSKKKRQDQVRRQRLYEQLNNRKKDIRHKIVSAITKNYKCVVFQDESIHAWHTNNHGKKIQHSAIGAILEDLKHKSFTPIMIDKFFPSTQLCPECGKKNKMTKWQRTYECECGFKEDRDIKSARCLLEEGLKMMTKENKELPMDRRDFKARENVSATFFESIPGIKVSKTCSTN